MNRAKWILIVLLFFSFYSCETLQTSKEIGGYAAREFLEEGGKEAIANAVEAGVLSATATTDEEKELAKNELKGAIGEATDAAIKAVGNTVTEKVAEVVPDPVKPYIPIVGTVLNFLLLGLGAKYVKGRFGKSDMRLKETRGKFYKKFEPLEKDLLLRENGKKT